MYEFRYQKVMYRAHSLKDAHRQFERDVPNWLARGYILHSQVWAEEQHGCLYWFFPGRRFSQGQLWVTYEKVG
jgi:hypothetical protein